MKKSHISTGKNKKCLYLKSFHESEPEEKSKEEEQCSPSRNVMPEACLLLYDSIERADAGEDEQECRDEEAGVVQTLGLGQLHHPPGPSLRQSEQIQPNELSSEPVDYGGGTEDQLA